MASDNWKREAWVRFAAEVAAVGVSLDGGLTTDGTTNATLANHCGAVADALLSEVEQREREGRFGSEETPPPAGYSLKGWANPNAGKRMEKELADLQTNRDEWVERARRADAEVERLKTELAGVERTHHEMLDAKEKHARKAESLLKEALRLLGVVNKGHQHQGGGLPGVVLLEKARYADLRGLLARARQEGFSDGE